MVVKYSIIVFVTQLVFIACRTWNVKEIAKHNMSGVIISGIFVHLSWLVSIAIGSFSMHEIIHNFKIEYIPIVLCSLIGGLVGSYIGLKNKWTKNDKQG